MTKNERAAVSLIFFLLAVLLVVVVGYCNGGIQYGGR